LSWQTIRRETGLIEHVCEHGVGHPNAGSVQYMEYMNQALDEYGDLDFPSIPSEPYLKSSWWVHGCDGCCASVGFPGTAANAIKHAIGRYINERPDLLEDLKKDHFLLWWGIMAALSEAKDLEG
jgi:hypothetical protein